MGSNTREDFEVFCFSINMLNAPLGGDSPLCSPISTFKGKLSRVKKLLSSYAFQMEIRACFLYSDRFYFWAMRHIVFHCCFVLFVQSTLFLTQRGCNRNQAKQATAQRSQTLGGPRKHLAVIVTLAETVRTKEMSCILFSQLLRSCRGALCQIPNAIIFQYQYSK